MNQNVTATTPAQTETRSARSAARPAQPDQSVPTVSPHVNVIEDAQGILLYADLPGVPKDKLNVHVESGTLTIEGDVDLGLPADIEWKHLELNRAHYRRQFTLSKELDSDNVEAEFKQGVLTLRIPKAEKAKPRKVRVKVR